MPSSPIRPWWLLAPASVSPQWWLVIVPAILTVDYALGLTFQFTAVYVVPVTMAAWYSGRRVALLVAVGFPLGRVLLFLVTDQPIGTTIFQNTVTCLGVFGFLALAFARFAEHERRMARQIRVLEGLLPICSVCKNIRDARGEWQRLENFIQERSDAKFSHGLCPHCVAEQYDQIEQHAQTTGVVRAHVASAADRLR